MKETSELTTQTQSIQNQNDANIQDENLGTWISRSNLLWTAQKDAHQRDKNRDYIRRRKWSQVFFADTRSAANWARTSQHCKKGLQSRRHCNTVKALTHRFHCNDCKDDKIAFTCSMTHRKLPTLTSKRRTQLNPTATFIFTGQHKYLGATTHSQWRHAIISFRQHWQEYLKKIPVTKPSDQLENFTSRTMWHSLHDSAQKSGPRVLLIQWFPLHYELVSEVVEDPSRHGQGFHATETLHIHNTGLLEAYHLETKCEVDWRCWKVNRKRVSVTDSPVLFECSLDPQRFQGTTTFQWKWSM